MSHWLPALTLFSSLTAGLVTFGLPESWRRLRAALSLGGSLLGVLLVGVMLAGVFGGNTYHSSLTLLPDVDVVLQADPLSLLFASLSSLLWLVTTVYAVGYFRDSPNLSRFFGFFSLCVSATVGIALAGNLLTFLLFYEMLTLATYPLVVHRGTPEALRAGARYLAYTLPAGVALLVAVVWLHTLNGGVDFAVGGALGPELRERETLLRVLFGLLVVSLGVKAALVPLHGWLPAAMVAPAPVSSLLHAVAVVKAGAFGIVRVVYDVFGVEFAAALGVLGPLALAAAVTILYGSLRALYQDDLKRRLAYSTVSQVSYIVLGAAVLGPLSTVGGVVHLVHQGLMKITLFFCAGSYAETAHVHRVSELDGLGRRMPWTSLAFSVGALGMVGLPPFAGFVSKWYLALGGVAGGAWWVLVLLLTSTLLNAAYFLPILYRLWFRPPLGAAGGEARAAMLAPALVTAALALGAGLLAGSPWSPLAWARFIAELEYAR